MTAAEALVAEITATADRLAKLRVALATIEPSHEEARPSAEGPITWGWPAVKTMETKNAASNGAGPKHTTKIGHNSGRLQRAIRAIRKHGPMPPSTLRAYSGVSKRALPAYLSRWITKGWIEQREDGRYALGTKATDTTNS